VTRTALLGETGKHSSTAIAGQFVPQIRRIDQELHRVGESMCVALLHKEAVFLMFNEFAYAGDLCRDYRHPRDHGFEQNIWNSVLVPIFQN
jgi:hypothetical protein